MAAIVEVSFARRSRGFVFDFRDMGEGDCVLSLTLSRFSDGDLCRQGSMTIHRMPEQKMFTIALPHICACCSSDLLCLPFADMLGLVNRSLT